IADACDKDSDNDGIPDALEDLNGNGKFEDDDVDGNKLVISELGDGISSYLDLDSDNDGILDLFESGIPASVIDQIDTDHNGVIDSGVAVGNNGIADVLETAPDSGVMKYPLKNTDGDDKPDFVDLKSNNVDFDLYTIGKDNLDDLGEGFISRIDDADADGIQAVVDTDLVKKGSPNSPLSPYSSVARNSGLTAKASLGEVKTAANDVKVYPNPVKAGENLNVKSNEEGVYTLFSAQGQLIKSGKFSGNAEIGTSSLPVGMYVIKVETKTTVKSYKVIVR
ncbi:T9SS type A sorting domain-containing protein, partial [Chryseobacterium sp. VD8]|uniref:T9SS type A sorting domain-containing protein n=1 Tax=Chryseobacterium sp. VD8 TaxID=3081254 RepID=UPI003019C2EB